MSSRNGAASCGNNSESGAATQSECVSYAKSGRGGTKKLNNNAARKRSAVGWAHDISIDGDTRKIKCKYCEKEITGAVYKLKHCLARTSKDVSAYRVLVMMSRKKCEKLYMVCMKN